MNQEVNILANTLSAFCVELEAAVWGDLNLLGMEYQYAMKLPESWMRTFLFTWASQGMISQGRYFTFVLFTHLEAIDVHFYDRNGHRNVL